MATAKTKAKPAAATVKPYPPEYLEEQEVPEGFRLIGGGYAQTWEPEVGDVLTGETTSEVKTVELTHGRKKSERRCVEIEGEDGVRKTLWESAALGVFFDHLAEAPVGVMVYVCYQGLGKAKKAGQHPPKLFTTAVRDF